MTKLRHYDNWGTSRFITFSCYHSYSLLTSKLELNHFINILRSFLFNLNIKILGYVIMPNHVHLVLFPPDDIKLGLEIGKLKAHTARSILTNWREINHPNLRKLRIIRNGIQRSVFWQKRCYDHNCRSQETTTEKINYCHNNPVNAGLVDHPSKWKWSSYNWYQGNDNVPLKMDIIL